MKDLFYNADRHYSEFLSGSTMSAVQNFLKTAIFQHDFQIFLEPKTTRDHALQRSYSDVLISNMDH